MPSPQREAGTNALAAPQNLSEPISSSPIGNCWLFPRQATSPLESDPVMTQPRWCPPAPLSRPVVASPRSYRRRVRPPPHLSPRPLVGTGSVLDSRAARYLLTRGGAHNALPRFDHLPISHHGPRSAPDGCSIRERPGTHSPGVMQHGSRDARCAVASVRRCEGRDRPHLAHDAPSRWSI